jgi:hypothetical protein
VKDGLKRYGCHFARYLAFGGTAQVSPITKVSRAASITALVTSCSALIRDAARLRWFGKRHDLTNHSQAPA